MSKLLDSDFEGHHYGGVNLKIELDTRNNKMNPSRGLKWISEASSYYDFSGNNDKFTKLKSELSLYLSFKDDPRIIFAMRFGGAKNIGDYQFFHSNYLGRNTNLRGYRENRFSGDSYLFQNTEVRIRLKEIRSYYLNGSIGISIFNDVGKVWLENEDSSKWHNGYGAELWLIPFDFTIMSMRYNKSEEDEFIDFKFSYLF